MLRYMPLLFGVLFVLLVWLVLYCRRCWRDVEGKEESGIQLNTYVCGARMHHWAGTARKKM